ncbi:hypothetical protein ACG904_19135, partial [Acinetobacter guillouiae]
YGIRSTTYPSYALNLAQLGALCISNLCATKPIDSDFKKYFYTSLYISLSIPDDKPDEWFKKKQV